MLYISVSSYRECYIYLYTISFDIDESRDVMCNDRRSRCVFMRLGCINGGCNGVFLTVHEDVMVWL